MTVVVPPTPTHHAHLNGDAVTGLIARLTLGAVLAMGLIGCAASDETTNVAKAEAEAVTELDTVASGYFGTAQVAQGSSLDMAVDKVANSADVAVVETPTGVSAAISDADDGSTRLRIEVADDAPLGSHALTFEIAGEPQPVNWPIEILPR